MKKILSMFMCVIAVLVFTVGANDLTVISASAANVSVGNVSVKTEYTCTTNAIRINWNKVSGATGYRVYRYNGKNWVNLGTVKNGNTLTFRDGKCNPGTLYQYKVKAYKKVDGTNYWGNASTAKYASTKSLPLTMKGSTKTKDAVRLNWNKTTGNGYQVYQLKGSNWVKIATIRDMNTTTYRVSGLKSNTKYQFRVRAYRTDTKGRANAGIYGTKTVTTDKSAADYGFPTPTHKYDSKLEGTTSKIGAPSNKEQIFASEVIRLVNVERAKAGVDPLTESATVNRLAYVRTKETDKYFSHTRPDGRAWYTVFDDYKVSYNWATGENVAIGFSTPKQVVNAWMNSSGHRSNILNASFTQMGVGNYNGSWVQLFRG